MRNYMEYKLMRMNQNICMMKFWFQMETINFVSILDFLRFSTVLSLLYLLKCLNFRIQFFILIQFHLLLFLILKVMSRDCLHNFLPHYLISENWIGLIIELNFSLYTILQQFKLDFLWSQNLLLRIRFLRNKNK